MKDPLNSDFFALMKPKPSPFPLIRIGGDRDGGYLLPNDLEGIEACFSPGVNNYKYFEDELAAVYGIRCHMCDYSSDESRLRSPLIAGMQTFDKKWLDIDCSPDSFSLDEWVQLYSPHGGDLLLQMDIEGAEYRNLLSSSADLLNRFRIIVIELHGLRAFLRKDLPQKEIGPLLLKLDQTHICIHAHPNNCCGEYLDEETGLNFPGVIELTYLRRDRFQAESLINPQIPHPLDICRNARGYKPIHLNELWLHPYPRTIESEIKILEDELAYKRWAFDSGFSREDKIKLGLTPIRQKKPSFLSVAEKFGIKKPKKLLHIGANYGQEAQMYADLGIEAWHVEAIPDIFRVMSENISGLQAQHAVCACLSSTNDQTVNFNIANNGGQSSSILPLGRHQFSYPTIKYVDTISLKTRTIDGLVKSGDIPPDIDFILIDAQGAELMILEGAKQILTAGGVNALLIETAVEPLYEEGATYLDVGAFLQDFDLHLCQAIFNKCGWTNALYSKSYWQRSLAKIETNGKNIALLATCTQSSLYGSQGPLTLFTGIRTGGYSFHTKREKNAWIKLSFCENMLFHEILIFNRLGKGQERSKNIEILVSSDDENWSLVHENHAVFGGIDGSPLRISCPGTCAKHILFRLLDENYLHLDSIEVYS